VFGESASFFNVVPCSESLRYLKWWRRFDDLFHFLGYLSQGIVGGVWWSDVFLGIELFKFPCYFSALSSYCCCAICSNSCMSEEMIVTSLTYIGGGFLCVFPGPFCC
jgi:hypothetical protein